ncbi:NAD(P)/FAD-dependent oxidoreductase [Burkholderia stagnalis]
MTGSAAQRVVIVGAGHSGGRAAISLRQAGYEGPVTVVGDEPHLPYERPPLSKDVLTGAASPGSTHLQDEAAWQANGIGLRLRSHVEAVDREAKTIQLDDGTTLPYDVLILATGARARPFPGECAAGASVHLLRSLNDAAALRCALRSGARLGVLGAGFIGLEVASSALKLGARPVVVEAASRPLARLLPTTFADWLAGVARSHGVVFRFDSRVRRITPRRLTLESGETLPVDLVVAGIGAVPNDELAVAAGLPAADGILVDAQGRTVDPFIYAIGDVARRPAIGGHSTSRIESWRNAEDDARKVAAILCGHVPPPDSVPWFWTDAFGHNIQMAGEPSDRFTAVVRGDPQTGPFIVFYLEGDVLRGVIGVDCGRDVRVAQKLIGGGQPTDHASLPTPRAARRMATAAG